jgi:hypothetical protein
MYNIITCQPIIPIPAPSIRPPRLGNPKPDSFSTQKKTAQNVLSLPPTEKKDIAKNKIEASFNKKIENPSIPYSHSKTENIHSITQNNPSGQALEMKSSIPFSSLMGASGYNYNFISFTEKENRETIKSLKEGDRFVTLKKKGVGEFADLGRLMNPNINQEFQDNYKSNPNLFRRVKGMCSTLCDTEKGYGRRQFRKFKY